jgi:MFS family permease
VSPTFRALRNRNYRFYASGQVVSNTGTWMQRVAQDWLILELTHNSGSALGITTGLQFLPMLLFGLWGGVIADRFPKRRLLMCTQASAGVLALTLGLLDVSGVVQAWHVYLLAFGLGVVTSLDNPSRQSFVVEMVGRDDLQNAIALNSATFNAARLFGPAIAGLMINMWGTSPVFFVNAVSYGAVIIGLAMMRPAELLTTEVVPRARGQLREGLAYVWGRPDLLLVIIIVFFVGTFGLNFQMTLALIAKETFHRGAGEYGLLSTVLALGTLSGALLAARRSEITQPLVVGAALVFGCLEFVTGLMPSYLTFAVLLVPTGAAAITLMTSANSTMQLRVAPRMRGRVMGLYMLVFMGGTPIGAPVIGWLAEVFGPRWSLLIGGAVSALATVGATAVLARKRGLVVSPPVFRRRASARRHPELVDEAQSA